MEKRNIWTIIKSSFTDRLKVRVIFITILTVICSSVFLFIISNLILNKNYLEIERVSVTHDLARVDQALLHELTALDTITIDWGAWDDTYAFAQDGNEDYIDNNFTASTFEYLSINLIAVVNTSGEIVAVKCYDLDSLQEIEAPADIYSYLTDRSIYKHDTTDSSYSGILPLSESPLLFASRPILKNDRQGPIGGAIIMGRFLNDSMVDEISEITVLSLYINPYEDNPLSEIYSNLGSLSEDNPVILQPLNSTIISGHSLINDFYGEPCLVASIEVPRTIFVQGQTVIFMLYAGIFLTSLLLILVNIRFLESSVFNRLFLLGKSAEAIGNKVDFSSRISMEGNDELSLLAGKMNLMLSKLAEVNENLKDSQAKYSTIVEKNNDGVLIVADEKIKYVNPKIVQIVGLPAEKCIGMSLFDFVFPEDKPIVMNNYTARMSGQPSPDLYEINLLHSSGSIVPVEINAKVIDIAGEKNDVIMVRDISERKYAEKKLMAQKEMIDRIIASTPNSFIVVDSEHRIILANETFYNTFVKAQIQVEGKKIEDIVVSDELHYQVANAFLGVLDDRPAEFRYEIEGGERIFNSHIINMEHEVLLIVSDVTEERLRQESFMVTDRLASIGEMASGIAHEINNPLTGVVGFSQLLIKRDIPSDIREDLEVINHEARRAAKIVSGLLTFAYQGKTGLSMADINEILLNTLELRTSEMELNNIKVVKRLADDLPLTAVDGAQIQQVFLNIMLNAEQAMKTMRKKGTLTVSTAYSDNKIIITFSDTGPGISKENLSRIFNPFFTTKKVGEGTGLGLSMSHGIIKQHNGNIYAESEEGAGARFIVELPVVNVPDGLGDTGENEASLEWNEFKKGLLVDDEKVVLGYLGRLLNEWGYETDAVGNAKDAIDTIKKNDYAFILLDVKMPDMDGITLYRKLVKMKPELARKIVFVTGDVLERTTSEFFKTNNIPNITKPVDIDKLRQKIEKITNAR